jgi:peroxiredoxin
MTAALSSTIGQALAQARSEAATLNERLRFIAATVARRNPATAEAVERLIARLRAASAGADAPKPGERMPPFVLPDQDSHLATLEALLAEGPVAIAFNRGHWCPYCRIAAATLAEMEQRIDATGGRVVAILPERQGFARRFRAEAGGSGRVLMDIDNGYALSLGLVIWLGEEMQRIYTGAGYDLPLYQGNTGWMLPIPATFVVATDGTIVARHLDPDYRQRMEVDALIAALQDAIKAAEAPRRAAG